MPARWRWWGLGGSALLALSAVLAGALPSGDPGAGFRTGGFAVVSGRFTLGLTCWLVGAVVLCLAWLRFPAATLRETLVTGAIWALPLLVAPPLGSRDLYAYACQGWVWWHGHDPYTEGVLDGGCPTATSVPELWWHTPAPYGPLALLLSGLASATGVPLLAFRLFALLAAALLAWQLPRLASLALPAPLAHTAAATPAGHAMALRFGLVTPLVLVHGFSGVHHDLLVAALLVAALSLAASSRSPSPWRAGGAGVMLAASSRSPTHVRAGAAGLLLAAAVGIKATALVGIPFLLILAGRRWWVAGLSAVAGFAGLSAIAGLGLGWVPALRHTGELAQWSSPPTAAGMSVGYLLKPLGVDPGTPITVARVIGLIALAAFAAVQVVRAWQGRQGIRPVIVACGATLAATVLLGPVFYPWYAMAPIAVLAVVTRKWLAPAIVLCTFLVLPNGLGLPVLSKAVGAFAVTAVLVVAAIRRLRPARAA
jgi:alpha-1,6-mannosyltransferase